MVRKPWNGNTVSSYTSFNELTCVREEDRERVFDGEGEMEFSSCITYLALGAGAGVISACGDASQEAGKAF